FTPKRETVSKSELRRKNLCFHCNDPWEPGHRCLGKGKIHLIKVEDEESEDEQEQPTPGIANEGRLTYLSGAPKYNPFMFEGTMFGCRIMALLDSGSTHNFLDAGLVDQKGLQCDNFEGFDVTIAGGLTLPCKKKVNQVNILFGEYTLCDDFYVMDLKDNNVVLGMQWLHSLGRVTQDVEAMELSFQHKGKQVTLIALKYTPPHQMTAKSMIVWDPEPSREDIYVDFSLHISTDQQGDDEECSKFEAYMRTLVSLMTIIGAAIPAVAVQQVVKSTRRNNESLVKSAIPENVPTENEKSFFCERVCTSQRMLNKVGGFSKDPTPNTCVTVCVVSQLDSCTEACARAVCANEHHLPNWNDVCLRRCQNQCLKLRSDSPN
ncbi:hypothetical protein KI387_032927, partial [Taxus chinensis]